MPLDLASIPILDHHCHAFIKRSSPYSALEFQGFFSEGGDQGIVAEHTLNSVFFRWAIKEIAKFLHCAPTTEAVSAARVAMPLDELSMRMLRDANILVLLIDYGLGGADRMSVDEMRACLPEVRIEAILRLETMAQDLILKHETFDQVVEEFVGTVEGARAAGHVGLKSIIAYRTGLAIREPGKAEAVEVFGTVKERARRDGTVRLADKPLNDYLILRASKWRRNRSCLSNFTRVWGIMTSTCCMRIHSTCAHFLKVAGISTYRSSCYMRVIHMCVNWVISPHCIPMFGWIWAWQFLLQQWISLPFGGKRSV